MTIALRNTFTRAIFTVAAAVAIAASVDALAQDTSQATPPRPRTGPLDPCGKIHIPIGIANTVDTLKTIVEAEGSFSPGCGSYGVYFWAFDPATNTLVAPTMDGVECERGLSPEGYLIPWSSWSAGDVRVTTRVCHVLRKTPGGDVHVVGAKAELANRAAEPKKMSLIVALRPLGPAGYAVNSMTVDDGGDALQVDGQAALVCKTKPAAAGVSDVDSVAALALEGKLPTGKKATSGQGDCSGAVRYDLTLAAGETIELHFVCPVLPGRRAVGHQWDGTSEWAQLDLNAPNPSEGGTLQPAPNLDDYRAIKADALFDEATAYWKDLAGRASVVVPDQRWRQAFAAILGHVAVAMNEDAPDVAVINYNVYSRDGVYVANILQKAGRLDLSALAIDYFVAHPFNGRTHVEADNPGQVLWAMGQQWQLGRDAEWLRRVYPSAAKIAAMIRYYRTSPPPHYVKATSLEFGQNLPPDQPDEKPANRRQILQPGSCDGLHPEYTEAFDIAGLRAAAVLATAADKPQDATAWQQLADSLHGSYDKRFGPTLPKHYGSFCVLWPCRLYPLNEGKAHEQFKGVGAQQPTGWRYFPLAGAHQGLLAGNREAGYATIDKHLSDAQMAGWYAFDEGGGSGEGGWSHYRTTWQPSIAMPHGWAIAELWLLLRDSLVFEDGDRLVLLAGVPPAWFTQALALENLPTAFGPLGIRLTSEDGAASLTFGGKAAPPGGFILRLPPSLRATVAADGQSLPAAPSGDVAIPAGTKTVQLTYGKL